MQNSAAAMERDPQQQKKKKATTKRRIVEVLIAIVILLPALLLTLNLKRVVINRVLKAVELKPNSEGFKSWLNPPTTITRGYYLFNVSNPIDVVTNPAATPLRVRETLPYSYLLSAAKNDVQWSPDGKSLSYSIYRLFTRHATQFRASAAKETGVFVDLLRAIFRSQFGTKPSPAFYAMGGSDLFYHRNAVEQLEGFTSELFFAMQDKMTGPNTAKSGLIYRYNHSRNYNFTIRAGLMEKGQVLAFASENVPFSFSSNDYNFPVYDGLTFIPMLFDKPSMNVFQSDFCRPINVRFNRVVRMFGGIDAHEYVIKLVDFTLCTDPQNISTCPDLDKLDVSKCISASLPENTIFLSKPHFYGASEATRREMNIEGLTPSWEKHEALIYFEPYSGTPMRAHHRVQLNIDATVDPMRRLDDGERLEPTNKRGVRRMIPLVWIDQEVNVDAATIRTLRTIHIAIRHGKWIVMGVAVLLVVLIIALIELLARRAERNQRMKKDKGKTSGGLLTDQQKT